ITYTRGKVVGGPSSVNGTIHLRGHKEHYNDWAARGCDGWSFEDVLPFYKKLEDHEDGETEYHGAGGPIRVTRHPEDQLSPVSGAFLKAVSAVCDIPILDDFNAENQNCASIMQMSCSNGVRSGTGEAYVQPSLSRPNFSLEMRALVHRVVIENGRAVGVEYEQSGNRVMARANREVILSGGAIGSPQLLMLSGVGPADHLREHGIEVQLDVPGVGKNLHDHILVPLVFRAPTSLHRGTPSSRVIRAHRFPICSCIRSPGVTRTRIRTAQNARMSTPGTACRCCPRSFTRKAEARCCSAPPMQRMPRTSIRPT
ncbi:MAG: GMC family oxidoreductase N-terminal domain-containing protein, partial [Deltaproteobacteria bacterium]|nr:GMC family oxidoreductase N-terminal domain-containing protein [Deltaproteobacteria bacterium]